jgi:hypothetical protein
MRLQEWREKSNAEIEEDFGIVDGYNLEQDEPSDLEDDSDEEREKIKAAEATGRPSQEHINQVYAAHSLRKDKVYGKIHCKYHLLR